MRLPPSACANCCDGGIAVPQKYCYPSESGTGRRPQRWLPFPLRRGHSPAGLPLGPRPALGAATALVLILAIAIAFSLAAPAAAQTSSLDLVSNDQSTSTGTTNFVAQSFTTGPRGGTVRDIQVRVGTGLTSLSVKLRKDNGSGAPDMRDPDTNDPSQEHGVVAEFNELTTVADNALNTLTPASGDFKLGADTTYWLSVHEGASNIAGTLATTSSDTETGMRGWTIGDGLKQRLSEGDSWTDSIQSLVFKVRGGLKPAVLDPPPAVSAVSASELLVRWWEPTDRGSSAVTGYDVQYREKLTTPADWTAHTRDAAETATWKWTKIKGLKAGTTYEVRVRARNAQVAGDWSPTASGTTLAAAPGATTSGALVSNLGRTSLPSAGPLDALDLAQQFTTGAHVEGYLLSSITVTFGLAGSAVTVKVGTGTAQSIANKTATGSCDNLAEDDCVTLTNPSTLGVGNRTFTAPAGTVLSKQTNYRVVIEGTFGSIAGTLATSDDPGSAAGWSIGAVGQERNRDSTGTFINSVRNKIRVDGKPLAPALRNAIPDQSVRAYTNFSYQVPDHTFVHDTGARLAYKAALADGTALAGPDDDTNDYWLKFDADTRTFSGLPVGADVGTVSVKVTARDAAVENGSTASDTFDIAVLERLAYGAAPDLTAVRLVSNTGQDVRRTTVSMVPTGGCPVQNNDCGQGFTTGGHQAGYRLTGITVVTSDFAPDAGLTDSTKTDAALFRANSSWLPVDADDNVTNDQDKSLGRFNVPGDGASGFQYDADNQKCTAAAATDNNPGCYTFTPKSGAIKLEASTRYVFVLDRNKGTTQGNGAYWQTSSTAEDAGGEAGWTIDASLGRSAPHTSNYITGTSTPLHIQVHGYREPAETQGQCTDANAVQFVDGGDKAGLGQEFPTGCAVPGKAGEIVLRWEPRDASSAGSFIVSRKESTADFTGWRTTRNIESNKREWTYDSLDPLKSYDVRVRTVSAGTGGWGSASNVRPGRNTPSNSAPRISLVRVVSKPTADAVGRDGVHDTYMSEDRILVDVEFDMVVEVTGGTATGGSGNSDVKLRLEIGGAEKDLPLEAVLHGGRTLRFAYEVQSADSDADGFRVVAVDGKAVTLGGMTKAAVVAADTNRAADLTWGGLPLAAGARARVDGSDPTSTGPRPLEGQATIDGNLLRVSFDKEITINSIFDVVRNMAVQSTDVHGGHRGGYQHPAHAAMGANSFELVLRLERAVGESDTVTLTHNYASGNRDALTDGVRPAPMFTDLRVRNDTGTKKPAPYRADVAGTSLRVVFDAALDGSSQPWGNAFSVWTTDNDLGSRTIRGTGRSSVSGSTVLVTLASAVRPDERATVSYTKPASGTNQLRVPGGGALVDSFSGFMVARAHDTRAPQLRGWWVAGHGNSNANTPDPASKLALSFDEPLEDDPAKAPAPKLSQFTLSGGTRPDGTTPNPVPDDLEFVSIEVTGSGVALVTNKPFPPKSQTINITFTYTPGDYPLRDRDGNAVAGFTETVQERDGGRPDIATATVDGETLTLGIANAIDPTSVPPGSAFTFYYADGAPYPNSVSRVVPMHHSGENPRHRVELFLAFPVRPCAGATPFGLSYVQPSAGPLLQALGGWATPSVFEPIDVTNELAGKCADETPFVRDTAEEGAGQGVRPKSVTLDFDRALDTGKTLDAADFKAQSRGASGQPALSVQGASFTSDGEGVTLTLSRSLAAGETAALSYVFPPSGEGLWDSAGNQIGSFSGVEARGPRLPELAVADATAGEGGTLVFAVTLDQASDAEVRVDYATSDGTATAGADYTATSGTLTFAVGETERSVEVALLHDTASDDGETLTLTLSNPSGATLGDGQATGTVSDVAPLTAAFEGLPDEHDGSEAFAFQIVFGEEFAGLDLTAFQNGALEIGNGELVSAALTTAGENRRVTVRVRPSSVDDVTLALPAVTDCSATGAVCASGGRMLAGAAAVTVPGPVAVLVADAEISEDAYQAAVDFAFTVNRAGGEDVFFDYATRDGTATAGEDYTARSGSGRIPAGSARKFWVTVVVHNDDVREGDETFTLELSNVRGAAVGRAQATGTITEPEIPPVASVADATASEGGTLSFAVTLDVAPKAEVTVDYATSDGTATAGADYTAASGTLTFAVGETEQTVEVALRHDIAADDGETLTLTLSNPSGATLGDAQATGTITNVAPPALSIADAAGGEGGTLAFAVILDAASDAEVSVDYATADGTATAGADYTATSGTLTFAAGETEQSVAVALLHDTASDDGETLTLTLSNPSGATLGDAEATGTVADVAPLTAAFEGLPDEHDGAEPFAFQVVFGEEFAGLDLTAFQNGALEIGNGELVGAALTTAGENRRVTVRVRPSSVDDVTLALPATADCTATGAVCATGGRMLAGAAQTTVVGPVALSVADAETAEDAYQASVDFAFTVNRASGEDVFFAYATRDGTATAGEDYTAVSGTGRIPAGSTRKFWVTVVVHNDDVREGDETFTLELSNVRGVAVGQGVATGTITEPEVPPVVSVADAKASEGGTLAFAVTLDQASDAEVTVDYATANGTATAGEDYTAASGALTFSAGETSKTVSVASLTDTATEGDETFTLTLSNPSGATLGDGQATGTITEPEAPPALSVADAKANEGAELVFRVSLNQAADGAVTVDYATADGTATAGRDYRTASGTLTFAAGQTSKTVSVSALTDTAAEADETFTLRLSNASGATLSDGQATGTVAEVAAAVPPALDVADATADEGGTLVFTVTLDAAADAEVTVDYATANGTATAGEDYTAASGTLTFGAGQTSKTVTVPAQHDTAAESDETFTLTLSNPTGATLGDGQATGTIAEVAPLTATFEGLPAEHNGKRLFQFEIVFSEEFEGLRLTALEAGALEVTGGRMVDAKRVTRGENRRVAVRVRPSSDGDMTLTLLATTDCAAASAICARGGRMLSNTVSATVTGPASQVRISASDARADEGGTLAFAVTLDQASDAEVSVDYATADGTATAGTDYTAASGTLTFSAGQTSKTVTVNTLSDTSAESDETFTLTLSNPSGAAIADGQATGTIAEVAAATPPALSVADATSDEGETLVFTVTLDVASDAEVTVDYATSDGTATAGQDYTAASGTLTFAAGQTSKTVSVSALSDTADEADETFTLTLSNPSGATLGDASATGTITNVAPPVLSVADATANEGATLVFTVTLDAASDAEVSVDYATSDGTATAGEDYTAVSGTLTFRAGQTSKTVTVPAQHDTAAENDETFTLTLSNPSGATLGDAQATGTIAEVAPLTAAFEQMPAEHNGKRLFQFEIVFSEEFEGLRLTALEAGALEVTGGRMVDAKRVTRGENRRVAVRVRPSSDGDMTLTLLATTDCAAASAICARGGRMLSNTVSATVTGPAGGS